LVEVFFAGFLFLFASSIWYLILCFTAGICVNAPVAIPAPVNFATPFACIFAKEGVL
jgi:hypothetical protein